MIWGIETVVGAAVVGSIISSPIEIATPINSAPVTELPPLHEMRVGGAGIDVPAIWGIEVVGSDLAKGELTRIAAKSVNVVVSDAGVKVGASRAIVVPGDPRKPNMLRLRITPFIGEGQNISWINRAIDLWNSRVPEEIPSPVSPVYEDDTMHGTHVAGIVGALNPSFGVSPFVQILDMNIFKGVNLYDPKNFVGGLKNLLDEAEAIAAINMSHGLSNDEGEYDAIAALQKKFDTTVVVAAGNQGGMFPEDYPLNSLENSILVGSMGVSGTRSHFSNMGRRLDIVAPGEIILSRGRGMKWRDEVLQPMSGTSMATPFVTGAAATLRALLPKASSRQIETILFGTAIDLGMPGKDELTGHGMLNVLKAVKMATRIKNFGLNSQKQIAQALTVKSIWNFDIQSRLARIEAQKKGMASKDYAAETRRSSLLSSEPKALMEMGASYLINGSTHLGLGLMFAALNRKDVTLSAEELDLMSKAFWIMTFERATAFQDAVSILASLSNVDLALKVYEAASPEIAMATAGFFIEKITELDASRVMDLNVLIAQKQTGSSTEHPAVASNRAH